MTSKIIILRLFCPYIFKVKNEWFKLFQPIPSVIYGILPLTIELLLFCDCLNTCVCFFDIVISQPNDVSVCEGRGTVFTCVLNTANTNIRDDNVQWYRFIKNTGTIEAVNPDGESISFSTVTDGNVLSSSLNITDVKQSYTGYYWMGTPTSNVCNTSLNVLTCM